MGTALGRKPKVRREGLENSRRAVQASSPPLVGIDISTSSVKLIELAKAGNAYRVESFAAEPMPSNAITDKVIMDVDAVGDAVRKAVKRASPDTKTRPWPSAARS